MKKFSQLLTEATKIPQVQYHSSPWENLDSILEKGLVVPKGKKDVTTHAYKVKTISTADNEKYAAVYNPNGALFKITLDRSKYKHVDLNKAWKKGETLEELINRLIKEYKSKGFDGIYVGQNYQSTVGNQTFENIPPDCIELVNSPSKSLEVIKEDEEKDPDSPISHTSGFKALSDLLSREYTYTDKVRSELINLITNDRKISEKSFKQYGAVMDEVKELMNTSPQVKELISQFEEKKKRPSFCAETIFDTLIKKDLNEGKKKSFENVSKPKELIDKMKKQGLEKALEGVSLGKDSKGYFVYTHRARSKSYDKAENIPGKDVKFIETTG